MIYRKVSLTSPDPDTLRLVTRVVSRGGVILSPTDTIYGLACDAFNETGLRKIVAIKERSAGKGFLVLVPDADAVRRISRALSPRFHEIASKLWPGPVTLLVGASESLSPLVVGDAGKIGCRVPRSPFLLELLRRAGTPMVSTSANVSGAPPPASVEDLRSLFDGKVDVFLDGGAPPGFVPSTVVDLAVDPPLIVREGLEMERVLEVLEGTGYEGTAPSESA